MEEFYFDQKTEHYMRDFIRKNDKAIFDKLDSVDNDHVAFKVNQKTLETETPNGLIMSLELSYECVGYDNPDDLHEYLAQGYSVCNKKNLDRVRGYFYNEVFINRYYADSNGVIKLKEGIVFK